MRCATPFALCLTPLVALAGPAPLEFGVFCAQMDFDRQDAPGTLRGVVNIIPGGNEIRWPQTQVPAEIGVGFGVWYDMSTRDPGVIRTVVTHPPMGQDAIKQESWDSVFGFTNDDRRYSGFSFEYPDELVQGRWSFRIFYGDALIAEQIFWVVPPETHPDIVSTCSTTELSS